MAGIVPKQAAAPAPALPEPSSRPRRLARVADEIVDGEAIEEPVGARRWREAEVRALPERRSALGAGRLAR